LFDVASSAMIEEIDAHNGALWSLCLFPDKRGLVTGSADKSVKFWQFELIADEDDDTDSPAGLVTAFGIIAVVQPSSQSKFPWYYLPLCSQP